MKFRNGICTLFIFSLTASALAERLHVAEMPHVHTEIVKPEVVPSVSFALGASGQLDQCRESSGPEDLA